MKHYHYSPPKLTSSEKLVDVFNEDQEVVCRFKRTYYNTWVKVLNYWRGFDWYTRIDVYDINDTLIYYCKKTSKWFGHGYYEVVNCQTDEVYTITYTTWHNIAPELSITNGTHTWTMKKELLDSARIYDRTTAIASWQMKATQLFKTTMQIGENSPIQDPAFFVALFHCIFYIGD